MFADVIGKREVDFNGNDGRPVVGVKLFLTYESDSVEGKECAAVWIPNSSKVYGAALGVAVGEEREFVYEYNPASRRSALTAIQ